ncbi:regulatory protein, luxR family [Actinokineospora alba]|uniref:Regulatory protein, luxR family n=1 Tax=Actinokineospora alba TaxID=504798 RepID=A0A1H0F0L3_9PSEU|nr:regulatory LuxR family protein [Actinokineospora alba]SDI19969.1 regulatory protein, luxR family [Actinokineospora alba]SDN88135.1 regulatory protein, luxR family [Actinokineospora alba]
MPRVRDDIERLRGHGLTWVDYSAAVADVLAPLIPFDGYCCHTVDPGTILFTGSVNRGVGCSGSWLAHHEYVIEDVNKWSFLARSGRIAGATSIDTHGVLSRSIRHQSQEASGFGDELRVSFVVDGVYWGAAGFLRGADEPWFTEADVRTLVALAPSIGAGLRRALLARPSMPGASVDHGPGVVVFDADGRPESISGAAERWIGELVEEPPPNPPSESKTVQAVAARARAIAPGTDPLELAARARVRTRSGTWLLLYGTRLSGDAGGRTAVIIHPATPQDVAPVIALAYGLTERECHVAMQCVQGRVTKEIARELSLSPYTVQDHLKSIFDKTGVRSRGELVGQIFLDHYATRWEAPATAAPDLLVFDISPDQA